MERFQNSWIGGYFYGSQGNTPGSSQGPQEALPLEPVPDHIPDEEENLQRSPEDIQKLRHNLEVLAQFPKPGRRLVRKGDSAARVAAVGDLQLNRLHGLHWATSWSEDLTAINNVIQKSFGYIDQLVSAKLAEGEVVPEDIKQDLEIYRAALEGFQNLCIVYGDRYRQTVQKDPTVNAEILGIATNLVLFEKIFKQKARRLEVMQAQKVLRPMDVEQSRELLQSFKGWVTEEERTEQRGERVEVSGIETSRQVAQDLHRAQAEIGDVSIDLHASPEEALGSMMQALHRLFGEALSDKRAGELIHVLFSQAFDGVILTAVSLKYGASEQMNPAFRLKTDASSKKNRIEIEENQVVFYKELSFNKVNNETQEIDPHGRIIGRLEMRFPLSMLADPRSFQQFSDEELLQKVQIKSSVTGGSLKESPVDEGEDKHEVKIHH